MKLTDIDWASWVPTDVATLLFVVRRGQVLLIRKKRGLGAGKINAPGGRLEPGEAPRQAAIREAHEEVGITPSGVEHRGELSFQFVDGYGLHVHVFSATGCEGQACESDEATPLWTPLDQIPYAEMWADDALWLPRMLRGESFVGRFVFDQDTLLDYELNARESA